MPSAHPEDATATIVSYDPKALTLEYVRFALEKQRLSILPTGRRYCTFTVEDWDSLKTSLVKQGLLGETFDLRETFTLSFL